MNYKKANKIINRYAVILLRVLILRIIFVIANMDYLIFDYGIKIIAGFCMVKIFYIGIKYKRCPYCNKFIDELFFGEAKKCCSRCGRKLDGVNLF